MIKSNFANFQFYSTDPPRFILETSQLTVKSNQSVEFKCSVNYGNPNNFTYHWEIETKRANQTVRTVKVVTSNSKVSKHTFEAYEPFQELSVSCLVLNGIFDSSLSRKVINISFVGEYVLC